MPARFTLDSLAEYLGLEPADVLRYGPFPSTGVQSLRWDEADVETWLREAADRYRTAKPHHEQLVLPGMEAV